MWQNLCCAVLYLFCISCYYSKLLELNWLKEFHIILQEHNKIVIDNNDLNI